MYKRIQEKITTNGIKIRQEWSGIPWQTNHITFNKEISKDKRRKDWCCCLNNNDNIVWGRIEVKENKEMLIKHYLCENKGKEITEITQCQGCEIGGIQETQEQCMFKVHKRDLIGCGYINNTKLTNSNKIVFSANAFTLERSIRDKLIKRKDLYSKAHIPAIVMIDPWKIENINALVQSEEYKQELVSAYIRNTERSTIQSQTIYEFYTDSSMFNREQEKVAMGAAWIQTKGPN